MTSRLTDHPVKFSGLLIIKINKRAILFSVKIKPQKNESKGFLNIHIILF